MGVGAMKTLVPAHPKAFIKALSSNSPQFADKCGAYQTISAAGPVLPSFHSASAAVHHWRCGKSLLSLFASSGATASHIRCEPYSRYHESSHQKYELTRPSSAKILVSKANQPIDHVTKTINKNIFLFRNSELQQACSNSILNKPEKFCIFNAVLVGVCVDTMKNTMLRNLLK